MSDADAALEAVAIWAAEREDVRALALVGSFARGTPHAHSDLDLVMLTSSPRRYDAPARWPPGFERVARRRWGVLTEHRLADRSGFEVDLGVATPAWAAIDPVDDGTRRVVADGMRILLDPDGLLAALRAAIG